MKENENQIEVTPPGAAAAKLCSIGILERGHRYVMLVKVNHCFHWLDLQNGQDYDYDNSVRVLPAGTVVTITLP